MTEVQSQTFRVFVSSTFSDLKAERDALQERVFPKLSEFCAERGARFQPIDLRWGVSRQASRDQQTMNICLREIARCQQVTPRPNFIVLMGDRYGWRPPPPQMPAEEFEAIRECLSYVERSLLEQWYRRDDNAVPAEYVLRPWEDDSYDAWYETEKALQALLARGARAAGLSEDAQFKYWASATHQEIAAGTMAPQAEPEHVFAFLRHINGLPADRNAEGYRDLDEAGEPDEEARAQLVTLKQTLDEELPVAVRRYEVDWTGGGPDLTHIDRLCSEVYEALKRVVEQQLDTQEVVEPLAAELAEHEAFARERARFFTGRAALLVRIRAYLASEDRQPLVLWGKAGSGKSALLAKAVTEAQAAHPAAEVVYRFVGATPRSTNVRALLEDLFQQIARAYGASQVPAEYRELARKFPRQLALATPEKPLILFLDALDQLAERDQAGLLTWLPAALPENVHLILSTLPGTAKATLARNVDEQHLVALEPMADVEAEALLNRWLGDAGRRLQPRQRAHLLSRYAGCPLPLYLKLAFEEARRWHAYDGLPTAADGSSGLGDDIPGILDDLFARLSDEGNHGQVLLSRSLSYLEAARIGLTEEELLDLLGRDVEVYGWFLRALFHTPPDLLRQVRQQLQKERDEQVSAEAAEAWLDRFRREADKEQLRAFLSSLLAEGAVLRLPVVLWSRLYADLEPYLTQQSADGARLLTFYHPSTFGRAVREAYLGDTVRAHRHQALAAYFRQQPLHWAENGTQVANRRKLSELPYQQAHGRLWEELRTTLTGYAFLRTKLDTAGVQALLEDYAIADRTGYEDEDLALVQDALHLSSHMLARDSSSLWHQLYGRLMTSELPAIRSMLGKPPPGMWLRPLKATLTQAGGPLLRTLDADLWLAEVAITADGKRALLAGKSGFWPRVQVWDLERGMKLFDLQIAKSRSVKCLAVSADGLHAVVASDENLERHNLDSGQRVRRLPFKLVGVGGTEDESEVRCVAATADFKTALVGRKERTVLWKGRRGTSLLDEQGRASAVALTPDGRLGLVATRGGKIQVWDLEREAKVRAISTAARVLALRPDGKVALTAHGNTMRVWDLERGEELHRLEGHVAEITAVALSAGGERALSGSKDRTVRLWDLARGEEVRVLRGQSDTVTAVALAPCGRQAVSGSMDKTVRVWDLERERNAAGEHAHAGAVSCVIPTVDGRRAISGSSDHQIKVWDLQQGRVVFTLEGHTAQISSLAVTPDGALAISGSGDHTLKSWDLQRGVARHTMRGHSATVNTVALSPDGRRAVSGSFDHTVRVWDLPRGIELGGRMGHQGPVVSLAMTPDGRYAVSGAEDKTVKRWDLEDAQVVATLRGHAETVTTLGISADGRHAISGARDKILKVWDLQERKALHTFPAHALEGRTSTVSIVAISSDGVRAFSAFYRPLPHCDPVLRLWDVERGKLEQDLAVGQGQILSLAITPDCTRAIVGLHNFRTRRGVTELWRLEHGRKLHTLARQASHHLAITADGRRAVSALDQEIQIWDLGQGKVAGTLERGTLPLSQMAVAADGSCIAAAFWDKKRRRGELRVWDMTRLECRHTLALEGFFGRLAPLLLSRDGRRAIIRGVYSKSFSVWDLERGVALGQMEGHAGRINAIALSADGRRALSGGEDNVVKIWDLERGVERGTRDAHLEPVTAVTVAPQGRHALSISKDATAKLWDLASGRSSGALAGAGGPFKAAAWTPDGRYVILGDADGSLEMWDLLQGTRLHTLEGHEAAVSTVAVAPDGRRALSGAADHTLRLWDLVTGQQLRTLEGHEQALRSVTVSSDQRRALSSSRDGTVRVWSLEDGSPLTMFHTQSAVGACRLAPDGVTVLVGEADGLVHLLRLEGASTGIPLVTPTRLWLHHKEEGRWSSDVKVLCPACATRFPVSDAILEAIAAAGAQLEPSEDLSLCLRLPPEAWENTQFLLECPACHVQMRSNPFLADTLAYRIKRAGPESRAEFCPPGDAENKRWWQFWKR